MSFYEKRILPKLVNCACGLSPMMRQRAKVVPFAEGRVLEVGIGTGLNLSFYDANKVEELIGIDPSVESWDLVKEKTKDLGFEVEYIQAGAEKIPLENKSIDTVVMTYTLCTIPNVNLALRELQRILKKRGQILFIEHGESPDSKVRKWQNRINPIWKKIAGGCNLNRNIPQLFYDNGLQIVNLKTMYLPGWKPLNYNYWGAVEKY